MNEIYFKRCSVCDKKISVEEWEYNEQMCKECNPDNEDNIDLVHNHER